MCGVCVDNLFCVKRGYRYLNILANNSRFYIKRQNEDPEALIYEVEKCWINVDDIILTYESKINSMVINLLR